MSRLRRWAVPSAILLAGILIATSILVVERWQIAAIGYGYNSGGENGTDSDTEVIYRLDRWTGHIDYCRVTGVSPDGAPIISCPVRTGHQ